MLILDTDHLTVYQKGTSEMARRLKQRLDNAGEPFATTIITVEEVMRGWMAAIRRAQDARTQIKAYQRLQQLFRFFATWCVVGWDEDAVDKLDVLRKARVRVGTMDLKIASICLARGAALLSRNKVDFARVPGLRIEDWLT